MQTSVSFAARSRMGLPFLSRLFLARTPLAGVRSLRVISSTTLFSTMPVVRGPRAKTGACDLFSMKLFPMICVETVALPVVTQNSCGRAHLAQIIFQHYMVVLPAAVVENAPPSRGVEAVALDQDIFVIVSIDYDGGAHLSRDVSGELKILPSA